jgi:hypothetical protein
MAESIFGTSGASGQATYMLIHGMSNYPVSFSMGRYGLARCGESRERVLVGSRNQTPGTSTKNPKSIFTPLWSIESSIVATNL